MAKTRRALFSFSFSFSYHSGYFGLRPLTELLTMPVYYSSSLSYTVGRYLQEYVEPQPAHGASATFSESQTFSLGSTDPQSVLLPLTEGCLTDNTGVPIIIVCTKVKQQWCFHDSIIGFTKEE